MIKTAVELFAGIGGFKLACDELGIETIWANDIDEKACKTYAANFGKNSIVKGNIKNFIKIVPKSDLLTAGFPCQPFSSAGKKQGIRDPRGTLFQEIINVLEQNKPEYFVLENVKRLLTMEGGYHFATILDALSALGYWIEWRVLNAINFGLPQHRERVAIIGIKNKKSAETYLLADEDTSYVNPEIVSNIKFNNWHNISEHDKSFPSWGFAYEGRFIGCDVNHFSEAKPKKLLKNVLELEENIPDIFYYNKNTLERIKQSERVNKFFNGVEIAYNQGGGARMGYTIFGTGGNSPTLTASTSRHYERYMINNKFRRLTNVEYARLQGFNDNHCNIVTPYDQYKLYGNAVPPPLIKWVISRLVNNKFSNFKQKTYQLELIYDSPRITRKVAAQVG